MDRFGLQKLLQQANANNFDVGDKNAFAAIVKESQWIDAATETMETAARKISVAIKRGTEPDGAPYTEARKKLIDKSKKVQTALIDFGNKLAKAEKAAKDAKNAKALKFLAELDKQLDAFEDVLADNNKLPHADNIILGLLGGSYSVGKKADKGKEGLVKRSQKVDKTTPGSSFLTEVQWTVKNVPSLQMKSVTKHEKAIQDLDLIVKASNKYRKEYDPIEAFTKAPTTTPDKSLAKLAADLTDAIETADKARGTMPVIKNSLGKLAHGTDREKSAIESLKDHWADVEAAINAAWKELTPVCKTGTFPSDRYKRALDQAGKATAKA